MRSVVIIMLLAGCAASAPAEGPADVEADVPTPEVAPSVTSWNATGSGSASGVIVTMGGAELCNAGGRAGATLFMDSPEPFEVPFGLSRLTIDATWDLPQSHVCLFIEDPQGELTVLEKTGEASDLALHHEATGAVAGEWAVSMVLVGAGAMTYDVALQAVA